ncbi:MAG TPA: MBL fold metallo-hydrolase [Ideonella sp.]|uniref:MBL fold metallo-hydrolase n=1 Tax=Ideonella sp. TaxID=1929293 RepID=UPI002B58E1D8|nr:MBL fold metallo-hydrolase [Ideonella sp.]HSI49242.1 MBL fold metallo-hydrolase [Ideonella sp.]
MPDFLQDLGHGVYAVDTGFQRPNFDAAYLIVDDGRAAFIDTGTGYAVPRLLASLQALDLTPAQVDWVIPTHVHLDHAGGVGQLMQQLPNAALLVHPRGLRHMLDPGALYQGARAVYGQAEMDRWYGQLVPVPAARAQPSSDGQAIRLGQRTLTLIDTPGHARHHHCIWDPVSRGWFTGDSFGISYRELDVNGLPWTLPTTTPVQFEPDAARNTIARLMAAQPERVYLTHYGALSPVAPLAEALLRLLDEVEALGLALRDHPTRHAALSSALLALYQRDLRAAGSTMAPERVAELLALDVELNAQGMACWLDRPGT